MIQNMKQVTMSCQLTFALIFLIAAFMCCEAQGPLCSVNSSYNICGRLCEPSCSNPNPQVCPAIECTNATSGCRCESGYLRDPNTGFCVSPAQCT